MKLLLLKAGLFLISICAFSSSIHAQQQKIDSLQMVINNSSDINKYEALISLIRIYGALHKNREVLESIPAALKIAFEKGDSGRIVQSLRIKGQVLNRLAMHKEAVPVLLEALPISRRNNLRTEEGKILNNLAIVYAFQAKYDLALDLNFQALRIREEDKDAENLSATLQNIGLVYYKLKDYSKGLSYFKEALRLKRKIGDDYLNEHLLVNIGLCHAYTKEFQIAKRYVDTALTSAGSKPFNENLQVDANFCLGVIHFGLKELSTAERFFLASYSLARKANDARFQFDNIEYLSQIYIVTNEIAKATQVLRDAEELIALGAPYNLELIKIYSRFVQLYNKTMDFRNAALYQQKYIELKDSIFDEALTTNLMKLEAEHLEKENEARITAQNLILTLKEEVIDRQKLVNVFIAAMAIMLILLTVVLVRINRQKQMINEILDEKVRDRTKKLEESHEALIRLSNEREILLQRTSQDINSSLATIKGLCILGLQDVSDPHARQYISKMNFTSEQLEFTLKTLQSLS